MYFRTADTHFMIHFHGYRICKDRLYGFFPPFLGTLYTLLLSQFGISLSSLLNKKEPGVYFEICYNRHTAPVHHSPENIRK